MNTDKLKKAMALAWNKKEYEIYGILKEIMDEGGFEAISPCPPNMYFKKNIGYYFIDNNDGPYCMSCFEKKGKLIHLDEIVFYDTKVNGKMLKKWIARICSNCNNEWDEFEYED